MGCNYPGTRSELKGCCTVRPSPLQAHNIVISYATLFLMLTIAHVAVRVYEFWACFVQDVQHIEYLLKTRFGFQDITVLRDDLHRQDVMPTKRNILAHIDKLVHGAQPNDSLFFHFSGMLTGKLGRLPRPVSCNRRGIYVSTGEVEYCETPAKAMGSWSERIHNCTSTRIAQQCCCVTTRVCPAPVITTVSLTDREFLNSGYRTGAKF